MNLMKVLRLRRPRLRLAWLGLLALVFQQLAFAAYACPVADAPPEPQAVMAGCVGMEMPDPDAPALCDQHCVRDHVTTPDLKAPKVPALALPPMHFALSEALLPPVRAQLYRDVPICQSDPPPAQRFCSLQI
ncbi:hypothetical protein LJB71_08790 [Thermomonas sp. S9]|jgi:hypothetical protein|uniref:hypothetical protein n=1 Tax=Thermomonas sp. S9 TaxID=2885203 RepID=UPI00216ADD9E|nr:hypothetical protein [Thermomonas sp. S9]MCR6496307.1 hypothetical protein [Thermomonas sp. S9]